MCDDNVEIREKNSYTGLSYYKIILCSVDLIKYFLQKLKILQVGDEGDRFKINCDPGVNCLNYCEWKLPNGQDFRIDATTDVYDYVWGSIQYVGIKIPNCNTGNCIRSCDIEIIDSVESIHKGIWTCTSNVKVDSGRYVDNINITFEQPIIGKHCEKKILFFLALGVNQEHSHLWKEMNP